MILYPRQIISISVLALAGSASASAVEDVCKEAAGVATQAAKQRMRGVSIENVRVADWPQNQEGSVGVAVRLAFLVTELHSYAMQDFAFKYCMVLGNSEGEQLKKDYEALKHYRFSAGHCVSIGSFEKASYRRCMAEATTQSRVLLEQDRGFVLPD